MKQRFVEYDLPLADISEESAREKYVRHGHPSTLHTWWARRPLATSRATSFAALVDDPGHQNPDERHTLRELIKEIASWDAVKDGNTESIQQARRLVTDGFENAPRVLDPFAGGGTIPLELLRLGCETHSSDYNPVAVLVEKATLEWPQQLGKKVEVSDDEEGLGLGGEKRNLLLHLVEKWSQVVEHRVAEEIGQYYPEEKGSRLVGDGEIEQEEGWIPVAHLWARQMPCQNPQCGIDIPMVGQYWLSRKDDKRIAYRPTVEEDGSISFELLAGEDLETAIQEGFKPGSGTVENGNARCPACGQITENETLRALAQKRDIGERLVAVIYWHPDENGKKYRLATQEDQKRFQKAQRRLEKEVKEWPYMDEPLPEEEINPNRPSPNARGLSGLTRYDMKQFKDLHNARQRIALVVFSKMIREIGGEIQNECESILAQDELDLDPKRVAHAVKAYLALGFSRTVDRLTRVCRWDSSRETVKGALSSDKKIPMVWDYVECNPLSHSSGSWDNQMYWVKYFIETNEWEAAVPAHVAQGTATDLPFESDSFDAIITDPPYYDNYPYADLADYFYVWLKRLLADDFPDLFSTPLSPKQEEAVMLTSRHESLEEADSFFENQLGKSFSEMHRVLSPEGVAVVVYAHKTTGGWETMLRGLVDSGFVVTASWPLKTEMRTKIHSDRSAFLNSSIYMVCRKGEREELGFWNDIQPEIKSGVEEKLGQLWEADLVKGGDFFISAIGPGMEAYSRYDRVETYSGEKITVPDLLEYIRSVSTDFLVQHLLRNGSAESVDKEGQFYLTYRWTFGDNRVEYDDALRIAKAEGVDLERLSDENTFVKKTRKYIYVHGPQDRDSIDEVHNMVDAAHLACRMWEQGRKDDIGPMLAKHGYSENPSFWQFCLAVAECLPEDNRERQLLQGMHMGKNEYQKAEATGVGDGEITGQVEIDFDDGES